MNIIKYELKKNSVEIPWEKRMEIKEGVSLYNDPEPELIRRFELREEALLELMKRKTLIVNRGKFFSVEEFYIEKNVYDEDGDWVEGGDVEVVSKIRIELIKKPEYDVIAVFDNMKEAEAAEACSDFTEVYLKY